MTGRRIEPAHVERIVSAWCDLDLAASPGDRRVIEQSRPIRAWIIEVLLSSAPEEASSDDLLDAFVALGRAIAGAGGSPTLASWTAAHAVAAAGGQGASVDRAATASLAEGFAAGLVDGVRSDAMRSWDYPRCAVPLGTHAVAIAAGHPSDDEEVLETWAARVASEAARAGMRRAVVSGGPRACEALLDALSLVGIETRVVE